MNRKKSFKYHLKIDVKDDLVCLHDTLEYLLLRDKKCGFDFIPINLGLPSLFKVFSHLIWCRSYDSWFKKVYNER